MEPFIGQIMLFGGNFAPRGFATCDGQLLDIASNSALFSILGTTYGGDGRTNFALPDLRGRAPVHMGQGPGLSSRRLGEKVGTEAVTLGIQNMPAHSHAVQAGGQADAGTATDNFIAAEPRGTATRFTSTSKTTMSAAMVERSGGDQPLGILPPSLGLNYCIALVGIFPSRS